MLETIGTSALKYALTRIAASHENVSPVERLTYHTQVHTKGVVRRAEKIGYAMRLTEYEMLLVRVAAAFHDVIQCWAPVADADGFVVRKRLEDQSEAESAEAAVAWMQERPQRGRFGVEAEDIVRNAIHVTACRWDPAHQTVIQPMVSPTLHPVARAVALADINSCGMEPHLFEIEGTQLFIENEIQVMEYVRAYWGGENFDQDGRNPSVKRYVAWLSSQVSYVEGRRALLKQELEGLSFSTKDRVLKLFSGFNQSAVLAKARADEAKFFSFYDMTKELKSIMELKLL